MTSTQHDIRTVQTYLRNLGNGATRGALRRALTLRARAAFDRLTLGMGEDSEPASGPAGATGQGVAVLIPEWERVHVGRGSLDEVEAARVR